MANVLVIGSGAREHVVAATFMKSPQVDHVYCAPGNPGMKKDGIHLAEIDETDFETLGDFSENQQIDLVFVGPEKPLAMGVTDFLQKRGIKVFGPSQAAAQLESDKAFAKRFMEKNGIPTANGKTFSDYDEALAYTEKLPLPVVVKETGLAGGKGVTIATKRADLASILRTKLEKSHEILIEQYLAGEEFPLMLFVGGDKRVLLPISQDHKKIYAGDKGPNTGGMGAYSPVPHITDDVLQETIKTVVDPTMTGLKDEKLEFSGTLYIGCMLTNDGIKVIEYNVRLGDPETQVLLPQLKSDFYQVIVDLIEHKLPTVKWQKQDFYLSVVVATPNYPQPSKQHILVPELTNNVYYAGVSGDERQLFSSGGRVFTIVDHAETLQAAQNKVYRELAKSDLSDFYYRKDIGFRDLEKD